MFGVWSGLWFVVGDFVVGEHYLADGRDGDADRVFRSSLNSMLHIRIEKQPGWFLRRVKLRIKQLEAKRIERGGRL